MVSAPKVTPPPIHLTPEQQARVEAYRVQFHAMGMTDEDIAHMADPAPPAEQAAFDAWLRGEAPCPFGP